MRERNKVKKGQIYKSKDNGIITQIIGKATGTGRHWVGVRLNRGGSNRSHKIHEGTLMRFHELIKG